MASLEELRAVRLEKLEILKKAGMNPYPSSVPRDYPIEEVKNSFNTLAEGGQDISIAGRVIVIRGQGAILFVVLEDGNERLQAVLKKDELPQNIFDLFIATVDAGDFISVTGNLFITTRGEESILIKSWTMAAKALLPLPDKWHGLQDIEERFRRRYLDTIMNKEAKARLSMRSKIVNLVRNFYNNDGYIEVETPRLQTVAGGATARPFITHHNALDVDFYLTIAQELYLKMLLVGGFTKVYEIGRKFRNEGIDATHNPEFTMLESQEIYGDAKSQRVFIEKLFKYLIKEIFHDHLVTIDSQNLDFSKDFEVITFYDLIKKYTEISDPQTFSLEETFEYAKKIGIKVELHESKENILDSIYKKLCRPNLIQPTFIIDYPVAFNPFAKRKDDDPSMIDRFQLVISGIELVNAFSELNNPIDQRDRYLEQDKKGKSGEDEISPTDIAYLEAMEYGMPPNGGIGIGIDRLTMFITGAKNIKEVILFPTLKPKLNTENKKKDTMIAVAVVNTGINLLPWQELNTIAHLNAAFGARIGKELFFQDTISSKDNKQIKLNIKHAIMIKKSSSSEALRSLVTKAKEEKLEVDEFTREMIETTNDKKVIEITSQKNFDEIEFLGVLIYGPKSQVEDITSSLEMY